jgi:cytochrome c biogenesis protein CcmG, thiol:disulfide interchange protein DsbE
MAVQIAVFISAAALVGLLGYGIVAQAPDTTIDDDLARGRARPAPTFTLAVLDAGLSPPNLTGLVRQATTDGELDLTELRGTPIVLNFWASWCDPCRTEAPVLERGWARAAKDGVLFLGVDQQDNTDDALAFLERHRVTYLNVREAGKETSRSYGTTGLPETFFISAAGDVVGHEIGEVDDAELRRGVQAAKTATVLADPSASEPTR